MSRDKEPNEEEKQALNSLLDEVVHSSNYLNL